VKEERRKGRKEVKEEKKEGGKEGKKEVKEAPFRVGSCVCVAPTEVSISWR
jgi:hypothetical protein